MIGARLRLMGQLTAYFSPISLSLAPKLLVSAFQVLSNDNAGKNKSYEKTNSEFVKFVSIPQKLHPFKNPHRLPTEPMGIYRSPHTHTIPIPMGIPMGIPIPTAALII